MRKGITRKKRGRNNGLDSVSLEILAAHGCAITG
jgi:hypothetical protein